MSLDKHDLNQPVIFVGKGTCPNCGGSLTLVSFERLNIKLNDDGFPIENEFCISNVYIGCTKCYFCGEVGRDFIKLEDGSYKYVTEAEKIYEEERMSKLPKPTHLHAEGNPFINTEE